MPAAATMAAIMMAAPPGSPGRRPCRPVPGRRREATGGHRDLPRCLQELPGPVLQAEEFHSLPAAVLQQPAKVSQVRPALQFGVDGEHLGAPPDSGEPGPGR